MSVCKTMQNAHRSSGVEAGPMAPSHHSHLLPPPPPPRPLRGRHSRYMHRARTTDGRPRLSWPNWALLSQGGGGVVGAEGNGEQACCTAPTVFGTFVSRLLRTQSDPVVQRGRGGWRQSPAVLLLSWQFGGVNRLLAIHEDHHKAFLRRGRPGSRRSTKPLCRPTVSVSPSVVGHGTNTLRIHTAIIFSAECKHSATVESPAALPRSSGRGWGGGGGGQ